MIAQTGKTLAAPRPSSPRQFFARIYGHLEDAKKESSPKESDGEDRLAKESPGAHSPAAAALVQLAMAAGAAPPRFPATAPPAMVPPLPPFFAPPRPPFVFPADAPLPPGFSAFLSRRRRGPGRSRRQRTTFSAAQTLRLEVEFRRAEYVGRPRRLELAAALRLSETQVKIWFQNRRAKDKRIEKAHLDQHYRALAGVGEYFCRGAVAAAAAAGECSQCARE